MKWYNKKLSYKEIFVFVFPFAVVLLVCLLLIKGDFSSAGDDFVKGFELGFNRRGVVSMDEYESIKPFLVDSGVFFTAWRNHPGFDEVSIYIRKNENNESIDYALVGYLSRKYLEEVNNYE